MKNPAKRASNVCRKRYKERRLCQRTHGGVYKFRKCRGAGLAGQQRAVVALVQLAQVLAETIALGCSLRLHV